MNKDRRAEIQRAQALIEEAKAILETCATEERDYHEAIPEAFQGGDKAQKADDAATALEGIVSDIENWDFDTILE